MKMRINLLLYMMRNYWINNSASFVFIILLLFFYFVYFIYFLLVPIYYSESTYSCIYLHDVYKDINLFYIEDNKLLNNQLNLFEINLPFYSTDFHYIRIIIFFSMLLAFPIITYIFIMYFVFIYSFEKYKYINLFYNSFLMYIISNYIMYKTILPYVLGWMNQHYNNLLIFEFNMQFNILDYISLYIKLFCINIIITSMYFVSKTIHANYIIVFFMLYLVFNISDATLLIILFITYYIIIKLLMITNLVSFHKVLIDFYNSIIHWKSHR